MDSRLAINTIRAGRKAKSHTKVDCLYALGLISTFIIIFNIKVAGISLFKYTAFGFGTYIIVRNRGRIRPSVFKQHYLLYFLITIISTVVILAGRSPYKEYSLRSVIDLLFLMYLCFAVASVNDKKLISFFKGVQVSCYVQIVWCFLQILLWYGVHLDINKAIFVDGLKVLENASKYNSDGILCISGLSFHPSNLIVVIIFTLALVKGSWKWPVSIVIALASRNSTTLITIAICMVVYLFPTMRNAVKRNGIKIRNIIIAAIVFIAVVVLLFSGGGILAERIKGVFLRIQSVYNGTAYDGSTIAHASYYTFLPIIWSQFSIIEILFGFSYGWTGGMFYYLFGEQYRLIFERPTINWGVESDPMNFIYGIGIIGAFFFYRWLIKTMIQGRKVNQLYMLILLALMVAGVFYCIQYSMVVVFEVALTIAISRKVDIFHSL